MTIKLSAESKYGFSLFIDVEYASNPGFSVKVIVEALDFEPLSTIKGFES